MTDKLVEFHESAKHRTKDAIPNLLTLVGYLAVLPDVLEKLAGNKLAEFWVVFMEEATRRGFNNIFKVSVSTFLIHGPNRMLSK